MKSRVPKSETFLSRTQAAEIFDRSWHHIRPKKHDDSADRRFADLDIEVDLRVLAGLLQLRLKMNQLQNGDF